MIKSIGCGIRMMAIGIMFALPVFWFPACAVGAGETVTVTAESAEAYQSGLAAYNGSDYDTAVGRFRQAFDLDERNTAALFALGLTLSRQGEYGVAADTFRQVLDRDPDHQKAWTAWPAALANAGRTDESVEAYRGAIERYPTEPGLYYGLGTVLIAANRPAEAADPLAQAVVLDSTSVAYRESLARAYALAGDGEQAAREARIVLEVSPDNPQAHIIVADQRRLTGNLATALDHYRAAARHLETKAYADHYIGELTRRIEEQELERAWEETTGHTGQDGE